MKENEETTAIDKNDIAMNPSDATTVLAEQQKQPEAQPQKQQAPNARKSLRDLVKESNNQKALEIKG
ncbi:hypothetical protein M1373_00025, partial [Candidatus Marsarchaeota archaeon]|nr:hypothetical protein [Candidatus Marsarchaeota archaeon]